VRVYILLLLIAAAVTFVTTPGARWLARRTHAVTAVRARDVHHVPTPRLGGLAILAGIVVAVLVASRMPFLADSEVFAGHEVWGIVGAAVIVGILGWADDVWELDWMAKLTGQIMAGGFMALMGVQLTTWPIPGQLTIPGSRLSLLMTIVVIVAWMNAVNFVDGLDGLAAGVIAIGGVAFFLYTYSLTRLASPGNFSSLASLMVVVLVGACVGFLPHNFFPARIFMGDSGSMVLGAVLAGATIAVTGHIDVDLTTDAQAVPAYVPLILPILVLAIPLLDMTAAVVRRVGTGKSPFHPDRMHFHHLLLRRGHSHRRAVVILYVWTAVFAFSGAALIRWGWRTVIAATAAGAVVALALTLGPLRIRGRILDDDVATGAIPVVRGGE
jgi:UDP-GlcNAc:undecaprenyl-phosphate GlcNAc-1-phosphate transferase